MPTYRICNIALESDLNLPELEGAKSHTPGIRFRMSRAALSDGADCEWLHTWSLPDGTPWLTIGRQARGYLLRFQAMVDFAVSRDRREILCHAASDTPSETLRHLLLDQVLPLVLSWRGQLVLHGSAVLTPKGTIAFVGNTGSGKSTLASSFTEDGMAVLTDDCLLLEEGNGCLTAIPSYPGVRLWPRVAEAMLGKGSGLTEVAHYTEKKRLNRSAGIQFSTRPAQLRRMYFLAPIEEDGQIANVRLTPLSSRDVVVELVKYTYLIDVTDRVRLRREFERLSRVATQPLFYRLSFPRDFSRLAEVRRAILTDVGES
jgi:hypothetical protein